MRLVNILTTLIASACILFACEKNPYGPTGHVPSTQKPKPDPEKPVEEASYAKGADISWIIQGDCQW